MQRSKRFMTSLTPYNAMSHSSLHKRYVLFRQLLPVPSCHSQLCAVCKHDHAAGYGMNMFQINDKRAMNGCKHALIQFLPYFIQIHVGLIFHFLCVDNRLTPPLFQIQDFVKLQTVPHPAVTK